jgi:hypothetical protein
LRATLDPAPGSLTYSSGRAGGYLGVGTLLLIALGVVATWRRGTTRLWLFAGALALWLSDGFHGSASALYALYAQIPFTGSLRTPERLRLLWFVCAIALAATGFDQLAKPATDVRLRRRLRWTVVAAGLGLALGSGFVAGWTGVWPSSGWPCSPTSCSQRRRSACCAPSRSDWPMRHTQGPRSRP